MQGAADAATAEQIRTLQWRADQADRRDERRTEQVGAMKEATAVLTERQDSFEKWAEKMDRRMFWQTTALFALAVSLIGTAVLIYASATG